MGRRYRCCGNNGSFETNEVIEFDTMLTNWCTMKKIEVSSDEPQGKQKTLGASLTTNLLSPTYQSLEFKAFKAPVDKDRKMVTIFSIFSENFFERQ